MILLINNLLYWVRPGFSSQTHVQFKACAAVVAESAWSFCFFFVGSRGFLLVVACPGVPVDDGRTFKGLFRVEQVAVGVVALVETGTGAFLQQPHLGVEIAHPGEFYFLVPRFLGFHHLVHVPEQQGFDAGSLVLGLDSHDGDSGAGHLVPFFHQKESQLVDDMEFSMEFPENGRGVGEHHFKGDGFVVMIGEPDQLLVNQALAFVQFLLHRFFLQGDEVFMELPGIIVDFLQVFHVLLCLAVPEVLAMVFGLGTHPVGHFPEAFGEGFGVVQHIADLLEVELEAVVFEKLLVVGGIVVHSPVGVFAEAFHQQSPEVVVFPEVDRPVHGFHAAFREPLLAGVEQQVGGLLVVDAFEETHAAGGLLVSVGLAGIDEGGGAAYDFAFVVI